MPEEWLRTERGRRELIAVGIIAAVFPLISLSVRELYPFSSATMFAFKCSELSEYDVRDMRNHQIANDLCGLEHGPNLYDPPVRTLGRGGFGRRWKANIFQSLIPARYGQTASREEVEAMLNSWFQRNPDMKCVSVTQTVWGARDEHLAGVIRNQTWKVDNPYRH